MAKPAQPPPRILLVEDSLSIASIYRSQLEPEGYIVDHVETVRGARELAATNTYRCALLDLGLPDGDGLELLQEWRGAGSTLSVVVITANASISKAVQAVREGAFDYLVKPLTRDRLLTTLHNAIERSRLKQAVKSLPQRTSAGSFFGFIGTSEPMQAVYGKIRSLAQSKAPVFITGESGTGKELCAEAIHALSPRAGGPFVAINCGAIPRDLVESEIFGHLKGSFTGAIADRDGAAKQARGGTLFLDEICELDLALQTKLLRFLQTGQIQRVGATTTERVDIRVICATNRSPLDEVREGRFREDLYYRLHVLPIHLPPLRERGADILMIARHFLTLYAREEAKRFERLSPAADAALLSHRWPGNVRELQNAIRQAVVLHEAEILELAMLPPLAGKSAAPSVTEAPVELDLADLASQPAAPTAGYAGKDLRQIEKDAIETAIAACGGSIPRAAKILGVSPSTIYRKREAWTDHA